MAKVAPDKLSDEDLDAAVVEARTAADEAETVVGKARDAARTAAVKAVALEEEQRHRAWVKIQEAAGFTVGRDENGDLIAIAAEETTEVTDG